MAEAKNWKNRIVGEGILPARDFLANADNWRIHPRAQQESLAGVLDDVGWVQKVIVNRRTSEAWGASRGVETLVDGHLRVTLALRSGDETPVPVEYVDLSPEEESLVLASLDPIAAMAAADKPKLAELMNRIQTDKPALQEMLSTLAERVGLIDLDGVGQKEGEVDNLESSSEAGEKSDGSLLSLVDITIDEPKHAVMRGDVWQVGNHALICCEVITEWQQWKSLLDGEDTLFMPYPGPFAPLSKIAETRRLIMVQPDTYISGHILDRYAEVNGEKGVRKIE